MVCTGCIVSLVAWATGNQLGHYGHHSPSSKSSVSYTQPHDSCPYPGNGGHPGHTGEDGRLDHDGGAQLTRPSSTLSTGTLIHETTLQR